MKRDSIWKHKVNHFYVKLLRETYKDVFWIYLPNQVYYTCVQQNSKGWFHENMRELTDEEKAGLV